MSTIHLRDVQVGDRVMRYLSSERIPMELTVTKVTDFTIECGGPEGWTFNREYGYEIDPDLGWGIEVNGQMYTGSVIEPIEK